jgi:membrane protease YdiL (CAAX protease family)
MEQNFSAGPENPGSLTESLRTKGKRPATVFLLFFLLVIWPLSSYFLMRGQGPKLSTLEGEEINLVTQIYLPTIFIQLLVFSLIILFLRWGKDRTSSIGLRDFSFVNLFLGIAFWLGISFLLLLVANLLQVYKFFTPPEVSHLLPRTLTQRSIWVIMALSASISEESAFRGFVLTRLNFYVRNWWLTILIASLSFSLGHLYQGPAGMVFAGVYGVFFSLIFLWRKSLTPCITAHFLQDITPLFAPIA